ncbi:MULTISPECIES: XRE family transcriptional regulator [unclassified Sphingomonas]|uniref:helix-turn-helix domain-containing protein n=1 Tax=unclassified Sphingomonas TaxID=196159 RepID=UPI000A92C83A|nr:MULTISPECIES: XRE family transcriptional regulator [unclassified Sphingomonas]
MSAADSHKPQREWPDEDVDPGAVLRQLRIERKMTLADVSRLTGLPVSTLSKVETGKMPLNYSKLLRLSQSLDLDITRLFAAGAPARALSPARGTEPTSGRRSVTRANHGPSIRTATYDYIYPAADLLRKSLNPMILDVQVRSIEAFGELMRHPGEEYAMVLEGQCDFHCDLYAPVAMEKGDSIYFDGMMGHAYVATGDAPCRILCVCSAGNEALRPLLKPIEAI